MKLMSMAWKCVRMSGSISCRSVSNNGMPSNTIGNPGNQSPRSLVTSASKDSSAAGPGSRRQTAAAAKHMPWV
eukprot:CAMPEP_0117588300 /NCGR_PEP_ID=MMETSP0784-20121206/69779_1 /TAXON_ID=39447 /ORGANISM="" /LENGTH=72 /DNA_ID=CAMNT_0005389653 /DNA_START=232 /DNA_END=450 /DNA_ORIENTATION=-